MLEALENVERCGLFLCPGTGGINHPFHLHGDYFYVMAMGTFEKGQTEGDLLRDLHNGDLKVSKTPAFRDTLAVPSTGYAVIRILTRNPGKLTGLIIIIINTTSILSSSPSSLRVELTCSVLVDAAALETSSPRVVPESYWFPRCHVL
jgi:hypothetical protein